MEVVETGIKGLLVLQPKVFTDNRGYFCELYNEKIYKELGVTQDFCQENLSTSTYGVIRGLHFQKDPYCQAKLATVIEGAVFDVAVDLRKGSPTFGKWYGVELTAEKKNQFLIPRGFAHGFSVLSETAVFTYKCDNFYTPSAEGGIRFDDPDLNIDWRIPKDRMIISEKDMVRPGLKECGCEFRLQ